MTESVTLNHGHRQRLRDRLLKNGIDALEPYELVELVLFLSIPRGDVRPIAKTLLQRYGSFQALSERPVSELKTIPGLGPQTIATLKTIHGLAVALTREDSHKKPLLNASKQLASYARMRMTPFDQEQCLVFYVNRQTQVIHEELHQRGTEQQVAIYPKEILKQALNLNAFGFLVVHNHPSGEAYPSGSDDALTQKIKEMAEMLEIELVDHLILTRTECYSYRASNPLFNPGMASVTPLRKFDAR